MKNKISLFGALTLLVTLLTGCGNKTPSIPDLPNPDPDVPVNPTPTPTPEEGKSTFSFVKNDSVLSYDCSLDETKSYDEYTEGTVTFKLKQNHFIDKIIQNDVVTVRRDKDDKFKFFFDLLPGVNTFVLFTYEKENIFNDNGILEGPDNIANNNGVMTDEVDDRPALGGIPPKQTPHYENEGTIYFIDRGWWNDSGASTNIICYNARGKIVNTIDLELGDLMSHTVYNKYGRENVWKWTIDLDKTAYIQFIRTGNYGMNDWNARTDKIAVDYPKVNCYHLTKDELWAYDPYGKFQSFAKVSEMRYEDYVPAKPETHGVYTVYCKLSENWAKKVKDNNLGVNIYTWGLGGEVSGWPGVAMEKVKENLYKYQVDSMMYQNIIFLLSKDGACYSSNQTIDLTLPIKEFGDGATIVAKVKESTGKPDVTWSEYKEN